METTPTHHFVSTWQDQRGLMQNPDLEPPFSEAGREAERRLDIFYGEERVGLEKLCRCVVGSYGLNDHIHRKPCTVTQAAPT